MFDEVSGSRSGIPESAEAVVVGSGLKHAGIAA